MQHKNLQKIDHKSHQKKEKLGKRARSGYKSLTSTSGPGIDSPWEQILQDLSRQQRGTCDDFVNLFFTETVGESPTYIFFFSIE